MDYNCEILKATTMYYDESSVLKLFRFAPLHDMGIESTFVRIVSKMARDGMECQKVLQQYPAVKYQALDFYYLTLQSLNALDEKLAVDLATMYFPGGVTWLSWLVLMQPQDEYRQILQEVRHAYRWQQWLIDLANGGAHPCMNEIIKIRSLIAPLARKKITLPEFITLQQRSSLQEKVKEIYTHQGTQATIDYLKTKSFNKP